ncbi:MAG: hypothetical protein H0U81_13775 [Pyrinomonadaceae bacterium]|nr:hypothetical protein [Pyrinomonadaceae bacterium]
MHCPQCGLQQVSGEVRFCRGCGFSLNNVRELLIPDTRDVKADGIRSRRIKAAFNQGLLLMLISLVLSIVLTLLHDLNLMPQIYVKIVAAIFVLAGLMRMFYPYIAGGDIAREGKSISFQLSDAQVETGTLPYSLPASHSIPITDFSSRNVDTAEMVQPPSVTENTTKLLNDPRDQK